MNGTRARKQKIIAFDSSVLIHHSESHPVFGPKTKKYLKPVAQGKSQGVMSVLGVTEVLTLGKKRGGSQEDFSRLLQWLDELTNLLIVEVSVPIAIEAARLRVRYGFKTPDALHLASAIAARADVFVTTDKTLRRCKEIRVQLL